MVIRPKDTLKLVGILIMCSCAVLICTLFLNYNMDLMRVKELITNSHIMVLYDNTLLSGKAISALAGGVLLLTTVVMLFFYIRHYIDVHKPELGILKAIGYSNMKIAKSFWIFGLSVFVGTSIGFASAFLVMPAFYKNMDHEGILPDIAIHFNPVLAIYLIILPTLGFSLLSVLYSYRKLLLPSLELIRGYIKTKPKKRAKQDKNHTEKSFLQEMRINTVRSRYSLVFFIVFSSLCYASITQMSLSVLGITGRMMAVMIFIIGIALSFTTLFLAITTVMKQNTKEIAIMRVFGYTDKECKVAILNGYRPIAYIGFFIGTVYEYMLLKAMFSVFYNQSAVEVPKHTFNMPEFIISFISFVFIYEIITRVYAAKIKKISLKEIMLSEG